MSIPHTTPGTPRTSSASMRRSRRGLPRVVAMVLAASLVLVGCGDDDAGGAEPVASGSLQVEAGDLYFDPEELVATAGEIEVTLNNVGAVEHDFVVEEAGDTEVVYAEAGESVSGTIELEAGTYTYYCSVPGHRTTMEGTLEVR